jgi:hypothetical protein
MMQEFDDAISAYLNGGLLPDGSTLQFDAEMPGTTLAGLSQQCQTPDAVGFGADTVCDTDIHPAELDDPYSPQTVALANWRRLQTPLGFLDLIEDDKNYGFDCEGLLQKALSPDDITRMSDTIEAQILRDPRNASCACRVQKFDRPDGLRISLGGTTRTGETWSLVAALTNAGLLLEAIDAGLANNA